MLRTALLRSSTPSLSLSLRFAHAARSPATRVVTCGLALPQRAIATGAVSSTLRSKPLTEQLEPGSEGHHRADKPTALTKSPRDAPATVTGDWVLFHPVYTPEELKAVEVLFREARTFSDRIAVSLVKLMRFGFDLVSGYKHKELPPNKNLSLDELRKGGYVMTEHGWLNRILFLESIAAVPGMVAATIRHLRSLRLMRRDSGWIHTLLEEAENERMHLMTFMTLKRASIPFRVLILGAQGVFYNLFFFSYLISPRTCHRFVGHIEEEAVVTYTRCIQDIEAGRFPEWASKPAPAIAVDYWRLPANATMRDVIYAVRSDESTHRFVNHSLASLDPAADVNPFALREPDMHVKGVRTGFERDESAQYVRESHELLEQHRAEEREAHVHAQPQPQPPAGQKGAGA